ncbi:hypothetical protein PIB30_050328 [Stylosanthes scabra]|uniref:Uncharacterized protein n=1 Tax=Stylosanthes scabra TaxID=79078 RepID=A0ABU6TI03_9FABA|nr:hypothetical protein [Stylosanthes scabra]
MPVGPDQPGTVSRSGLVHEEKSASTEPVRTVEPVKNCLVGPNRNQPVFRFCNLKIKIKNWNTLSLSMANAWSREDDGHGSGANSIGDGRKHSGGGESRCTIPSLSLCPPISSVMCVHGSHPPFLSGSGEKLHRRRQRATRRRCRGKGRVTRKHQCRNEGGGTGRCFLCQCRRGMGVVDAEAVPQGGAAALKEAGAPCI